MIKKFLAAFFCTILLTITETNPFTADSSDTIENTVTTDTIDPTNTIDSVNAIDFIDTIEPTDDIDSIDAINSTDTIDTIDAALLDRGYPQIVIDTMEHEAKMDIYYRPDLTFSSAYIMFPGESQFISGDGILPMIEEPVPGLTISLVNSAKKEISGSKKDELQYIDVKFSYHWTEIPLCRWQDTISISWEPKRFYVKDNSFYKVDKYDGYIATVQGIKKSFHDQITSSETEYANGYFGGVSWYADLKGHDGITRITSLHGYGSFQLIPIEGYSDESTVYAQYIHQTKP